MWFDNLDYFRVVESWYLCLGVVVFLIASGWILVWLFCDFGLGLVCGLFGLFDFALHLDVVVMLVVFVCVGL